jgi:hypothetical protein
MSAAVSVNHLRLIAQDEEDLKILSAHLQDAVVKIADLAYLPQSRRFAMVLNRYCWEAHQANNAGLRMRTGLHFDSVLNVRAANVRQDAPEAVMELLAIAFTPSGEGAGTVDLSFAGGGRIRLEVECIDAGLSDLAGPWPAAARPEHKLDRVEKA